MRYLKRFNEGNITDTLTTEMVDELRYFCRGYLAYLIDEGFMVQVTPIYDDNKCDIVFYKQEKLSWGYTDVAVKWSSIKDHFIPFLYMLDKSYNVIEAPANENMFLTIQPSHIKDIISETRLHDNNTIRRMRIRVDFKDQSITEAISQEDIKDFCEQYLAYLLDDGYALAFRESGRITQIDFVKPNSDARMRWAPGQGGQVDWMDWDHIKDRFIPFLQMLDKEYDVKDNLITFQCPRAIQIRIPFQDVINDKVKDILHDKLTLDTRDKISSIRIPLLDHSVGQYSWQIKEAKEDWKLMRNCQKRRNFPDDELQEVCDTFLPYLYDEGFVVHTTIPTYFMFKKNIITLWKEEESSKGLEIVPFYWNEIKDRFLPLFDYLNKYYPLGKVRLVHYYNSWERKENKKEVIFKSDGDRDSWVGHPFSKFEEIMSRNAAYDRPMKIGEIIIEVQNLDEL